MPRVWPLACGRLDRGYNMPDTLVGTLPRVKVSHASYDMLFFSRIHQKSYAVSGVAALGIDTASLMRAALDDEQYGWQKMPR